MSLETEGASFPSKYQQIRWIVSRQLIEPTLSEPGKKRKTLLEMSALGRPNPRRGLMQVSNRK